MNFYCFLLHECMVYSYVSFMNRYSNMTKICHFFHETVGEKKKKKKQSYYVFQQLYYAFELKNFIGFHLIVLLFNCFCHALDTDNSYFGHFFTMKCYFFLFLLYFIAITQSSVYSTSIKRVHLPIFWTKVILQLINTFRPKL